MDGDTKMSEITLTELQSKCESDIEFWNNFTTQPHARQHIRDARQQLALIARIEESRQREIVLRNVITDWLNEWQPGHKDFQGAIDYGDQLGPLDRPLNVQEE